MWFDTLDSPVGDVLVVADAEGRLVGISFLDGEGASSPDPTWTREPAAVASAVAQLRGYFAREREVFDLPVAPRGTPFQRRVWVEVAAVPFGRTRSYGEVAAALGQPTASRAVGAANGQNPLPIVVPCHRIVGAGGALTGFRGGVAIKRWLLAHEGARLFA